MKALPAYVLVLTVFLILLGMAWSPRAGAASAAAAPPGVVLQTAQPPSDGDEQNQPATPGLPLFAFFTGSTAVLCLLAVAVLGLIGYLLTRGARAAKRGGSDSGEGA